MLTRSCPKPVSYKAVTRLHQSTTSRDGPIDPEAGPSTRPGPEAGPSTPGAFSPPRETPSRIQPVCLGGPL
jgi:hypothetical protein